MTKPLIAALAAPWMAWAATASDDDSLKRVGPELRQAIVQGPLLDRQRLAPRLKDAQDWVAAQ